MPDVFDPYHKWLGIPPKDQPPNHYRLLGLDLFEPDAEVIDIAANRQMSFVQGCAEGPYLALSQKLLNEIAAARLCLLSPEKRAEYDRMLRGKLPATAPGASGKGVAGSGVKGAGLSGKAASMTETKKNSAPEIATRTVRSRTAPTLRTSSGGAPASAPPLPSDRGAVHQPPPMVVAPVVTNVPIVPVQVGSSQRHAGPRVRRSNPLPLVLGVAAMGGVAVGLVIFLVMQLSKTNPPGGGAGGTPVVNNGGSAGGGGGTDSNPGAHAPGPKDPGVPNPGVPNVGGAGNNNPGRRLTWRDEILAKFPPKTILLDNIECQTFGINWKSESGDAGKYAGPDYLLTDAGTGLRLQVQFGVPSNLPPGDYEIRMSYVPADDRIKTLQVVLFNGETRVGQPATVDQSKAPSQDGQHATDPRYHFVGKYSLSGNDVSVIIDAGNASGTVSVDSIVVIPLQ